MAIPEMPAPPVEVFDAIDHDSFCIFIGAGVSRLLGCSSWKELCTSIIDECLSRGWILKPVRDAYLKEDDKKRVLNNCYLKFLEFDETDRYFEIISDSCTGRPELLTAYNIYDELKKVPSKYVTTNFDLIFSNKFHEDSVVYKTEEFNSNEIQREVLYQIHGSLHDNQSIVLTTVNYLRKYNNPNYLDFLKALFTENLILFLGYGLREMEILTPLFNNVISERPHKNFTLRGYSDNKLLHLPGDMAHYSTLGIDLIPFNIETRGHDLLFDIIAYWYREIEKNCDVIFDDLNQINRVAK